LDHLSLDHLGLDHLGLDHLDLDHLDLNHLVWIILVGSSWFESPDFRKVHPQLFERDKCGCMKMHVPERKRNSIHEKCICNCPKQADADAQSKQFSKTREGWRVESASASEQRLNLRMHILSYSRKQEKADT